jgi:hypothetical protein
MLDFWNLDLVTAGTFVRKRRVSLQDRYYMSISLCDA